MKLLSKVFFVFHLMIVINTSIHSTELGLIDFYDVESIEMHKPILTAHRGGVVTGDSPECSLVAIRLAKERGYSLVELDIRRSADGIAVVFHDENMLEACGIDQLISGLPGSEITKISYSGSTEKIVTLDTALEYCRSLELGVMLDLKAQADHDFYDQIAGLVRKHGLEKSSITISGNETFRERIKDVAVLTVTREEISAVQNGKVVDLRNRYWFGLPERIPSEMVSKLKECGALVMPAINTFRYPKENHMVLAKKDIERLNQAGVDGYQIDSVYDDLFFENR